MYIRRWHQFVSALLRIGSRGHTHLKGKKKEENSIIFFDQTNKVANDFFRYLGYLLKKLPLNFEVKISKNDGVM